MSAADTESPSEAVAGGDWYEMLWVSAG